MTGATPDPSPGSLNNLSQAHVSPTMNAGKSSGVRLVMTLPSMHTS